MNRKALCGVPFFIVEKSAVMVYNKLLNLAGVIKGVRGLQLKKSIMPRLLSVSINIGKKPIAIWFAEIIVRF